MGNDQENACLVYRLYDPLAGVFLPVGGGGRLSVRPLVFEIAGDDTAAYHIEIREVPFPLHAYVYDGAVDKIQVEKASFRRR